MGEREREREKGLITSSFLQEGILRMTSVSMTNTYPLSSFIYLTVSFEEILICPVSDPECGLT